MKFLKKDINEIKKIIKIRNVRFLKANYWGTIFESAYITLDDPTQKKFAIELTRKYDNITFNNLNLIIRFKKAKNQKI